MKYLVFLFLATLFVSCGDSEPLVAADPFIPRTASQEVPCQGCLVGEVCKEGKDNDACGAGGEECVACENGTVCDARQVCAAPPECTPENCEGCCDDDKICHPGDTPEFCGSEAGACATCSDEWTCEAALCKAPPELCGAENCEGCCDPNGECQSGDMDAQCGKMGATCALCEAPNTCGAEGNCVDTTSCAATCEGCCVGETCINPTTTMQCGMAGTSCMDCGAGKSCVTGMCQTPSFYDIEIISTIVAPVSPDGSDWDTFNSVPEQYIIAGAFDAMVANKVYAAQTGQVSSHTHTWNQVLDVNMPLSALQNRFQILMKEGDPIEDDRICLFDNIPITADILAGNTQTLVCVADNRTSITWRLIPQ